MKANRVAAFFARAVEAPAEVPTASLRLAGLLLNPIPSGPTPPRRPESRIRLEKQLAGWLAAYVLCVAVVGSDSRAANAAPETGAPKSLAANANQAPAKMASGAKISFQPYDVVDQQLGGMTANRIAIPVDWKATSRLDWNINAFYMPVRGQIRAEAPDGGSWIEFYPTEMFWWGDRAHDQGQWGGPDQSGAIHHPNISLPEAMVRYVIARNRPNARNLRILGHRPVNNLPQAFFHLYPNGAPRGGQGICMRVHYEIDGRPVDEEFYGFMPLTDAIPSPPDSMEYHSYLSLVHSIGAKAGRLESVRPLLGFIATSFEVNPAWQQRYDQIHQAQLRQASQNLAQSWASIELGRQLGAQAHASNEAFLQRTDATLAENRAQENAARSSHGATANEGFDRGADGFDQYLRGTEHMRDQNGVVSDQYTDYNYHWTDGSGNFVHTDDPNLDPNTYLNGNYEQMTPQQ
jgi:hypothetical protein